MAQALGSNGPMLPKKHFWSCGRNFSVPLAV
jgi:hypothetical protein